MLSVSMKIKVIVLLALLFLFSFYQQFWVHGAFTESGIEQVIPKSPLSQMTLQELPELAPTQMFGTFVKSESSKAAEAEIAELFDPTNQEFIGQLGNYQFLLYATAEFNQDLSAKLLIKDLDNEQVELITTKLGDKVVIATVTSLQLSNIELKSQQASISLKLFSKITPLPSATSDDVIN